MTIVVREGEEDLRGSRSIRAVMSIAAVGPSAACVLIVPADWAPASVGSSPWLTLLAGRKLLLLAVVQWRAVAFGVGARAVSIGVCTHSASYPASQSA